MAFLHSYPSGAAAASSAVSSVGRITAWEQTAEQRLHSTHLAASQAGTSMAMPRFSQRV